MQVCMQTVCKIVGFQENQKIIKQTGRTLCFRNVRKQSNEKQKSKRESKKKLWGRGGKRNTRVLGKEQVRSQASKLQVRFHPGKQVGRQAKNKACIKTQVMQLPYERNRCSCRSLEQVAEAEE